MDGKELWKLVMLGKKLEADVQKFIKNGDETDDAEKKAMWQGYANGLLMATGELTKLLGGMNTLKNKEGFEIRREECNGMDAKELWRLFDVLKKLDRDSLVSCKEMDETNDERKKARLEGKSVGLSMAAQRLFKALRELNT